MVELCSVDVQSYKLRYSDNRNGGIIFTVDPGYAILRGDFYYLLGKLFLGLTDSPKRSPIPRLVPSENRSTVFLINVIKRRIEDAETTDIASTAYGVAGIQKTRYHDAFMRSYEPKNWILFFRFSISIKNQIFFNNSHGYQESYLHRN